MQLLTNDKDLAQGGPVASTGKEKVYITKKMDKDKMRKLSLLDVNVDNEVRIDSDSDEEFLPEWPSGDQSGKVRQPREVIFISAPSGCGKSYQIGNLIRSYREVYPDNQIYFLLFKKYDEAFEDYYEFMEHIPLYHMTNPINSNEFENALFIFDDCLEMSDTIDPNDVLELEANKVGELYAFQENPSLKHKLLRK